MAQSKKHSIMEAIFSSLIGYAIAIVAQIVLFPLFGIHGTPLKAHLGIGACFILISMGKNYIVRRWFDKKTAQYKL